MHSFKLLKLVSVQLLLLLIVAYSSLAQNAFENVTVHTPCEFGAYRLYSITALDSQRIIAVGSLGRLGYLNPKVRKWDWECLPTTATLRCVAVVEGAIWIVADAGQCWMKPAERAPWQRVPVPVSEAFTGIAGTHQVLVATTVTGKILLKRGTGDWEVAHEVGDFRCGLPSVRGKLISVPSYEGRVARSEDGGISWTVSQVSNYKLRASLIYSDSLVYVAGSAGRVFRSADSGKSYEEYALLPVTNVNSNDENETEDTFWSISRGSNGDILACGNMWIKRFYKLNYQAVYRGFDLGRQWSKSVLSERPDSLTVDVAATPAIGVVMLDSLNGVCITSTNLFNATGVHTTSDGGQTFELTDFWYPGALLKPSSVAGKWSAQNVVNSFVVHESDSSVLVVESYTNFENLDSLVPSSILVRYTQRDGRLVATDTLTRFQDSFTRLAINGNKMAAYYSKKGFALSNDYGRTWSYKTGINNHQYLGTTFQLLHINESDVLSVSQVVSSFPPPWGYNVPLISSDGGENWRIPEFDYQDGHVYGCFGAEQLIDGRILVNVVDLLSSNIGYQEMGVIDNKGNLTLLAPFPPSVRENSRMQPLLICHADTIQALVSQQWTTGSTEVNAIKRATYVPETRSWTLDSTYWYRGGKLMPPRVENWKNRNRNGNLVSSVSTMDKVYTSSDGGITWIEHPTIVNSVDTKPTSTTEFQGQILITAGARLLYSVNVKNNTVAVHENPTFPVHSSQNSPCSEGAGRAAVYNILGQKMHEFTFSELSELHSILNASSWMAISIVHISQPCGETTLLISF